MEKYIPINKRSKREQREFYSSQRNTWQGLNPATRTVPNGKGYNRNKLKTEDRRNSRRSSGYDAPAVFYIIKLFCAINSSVVALIILANRR